MILKITKEKSKIMAKSRAEKNHERLAIHNSFVNVMKEAIKHADKLKAMKRS